MFKSKKEELKYIQKNFILTNIIGAPGTILLGLGLYGIFGANGDAFIAILNNKNYAYGFVVVGGIIMIWEVFSIIRLLKRKSELENQENT